MRLTGVSSSSAFAGSFAGSRHFFFYNPLMPKHRSWRRRSESNRRIQLLQSRALPLGYSAQRRAQHSSVPLPRKRKFSAHSRYPNLRRLLQSSFGLKIPAGVTMPVINSGGVTSKPGLRAPLVGFATRTYARFDDFGFRISDFGFETSPQAPSTSLGSRSSIGMSRPEDSFQSIVDSGIAT